ncbi:MAG: flagellin [Sneathiellaceae bacterium]
MAEIALSTSIRTNLLSLQRTDSLAQRTQTRLATGQKVNSAIDDAVAFFQAKALTDRASDIGDRKSEINQAISSLQAANDGVEAVDTTLRQLKGILQSAKTASTTEQAALSQQFNTLSAQLNQILNDASYQGLNLLNSSTSKLSVQFSDSSNAKLDVQGKNLQVSSTTSGALFTSLGGVAGNSLASNIIGFGGTAVAFTAANVSNFDRGISRIDDAITTLRSTAADLGSNVTFLNTRLDFSQSYVNTLETGADKLTLADINEEGANLVALQTRQQLALQALSFAGQNERSVLSLFG